ncbi:MAG: gamma-glutamyl-gamma-aminobutyrate hydrolase family protein [Erysipelotrichaceae bacterium]
MKIIAITARKTFFEEQNRYFCNEAYIDRIKQEGCLPIIITDSRYLKEVAAICDGLIVNGGDDLNPIHYHQAIDSHTQLCPSEIDTLDFQAIAAFVDLNKPILGICRGLQSLNVYFNGSLFQHINESQHQINHEHRHRVKQTSPSFLNSLYPASFEVNSYHHQCIDQLGEGLNVCATSLEGYIEAIEHCEKPILGVQWHPEKCNDDKIIPYFLNNMF